MLSLDVVYRYIEVLKWSFGGVEGVLARISHVL